MTRGSGGVQMVALPTKQLDRYVAPEHKTGNGDAMGGRSLDAPRPRLLRVIYVELLFGFRFFVHFNVRRLRIIDSKIYIHILAFKNSLNCRPLVGCTHVTCSSIVVRLVLRRNAGGGTRRHDVRRRHTTMGMVVV